MKSETKQSILGLNRSEVAVYLALLETNPANGSSLSRISGVPRANIYDTLRSLCQKGYAVNVEQGLYAPLPPEEMIKRLRQEFETEVASLEERIESVTQNTSYDYVWTIRGYREVMNKGVEMISSAEQEIYVLAYPNEAAMLDFHLAAAVERGVEVKYVSMGPPLTEFEYQVVHPQMADVKARQKGRVFDLVKDQNEVLVGMFKQGAEDSSPINWAKNHWFVQAIREGIRHDFFHYFSHKTIELGQELSERERRIFDLIKKDGWSQTGEG